MNKREKQAIKEYGLSLLNEVSLHPHDYEMMLGSYLSNNTLFGRLIRWWERGDASHSSLVLVHKQTGIAAVELHALEGWGVISTDVGVLGRDGALLELRRVSTDEPIDELVRRAGELVGCGYEKPLGFVTKKRENDMNLWFCSEYADHILDLQNCKSHLVSPPWARRSSKARVVFDVLEL